jgi:hypothetical protein
VTFNTGDCLIEVTAWAGSTVFATALFFSLLSVERVKVYPMDSYFSELAQQKSN